MDDFEFEEDEDSLEEALENCAYVEEDDVCMLAGTEDCIRCPFSRDNPLEKGNNDHGNA